MVGNFGTLFKHTLGDVFLTRDPKRGEGYCLCIQYASMEKDVGARYKLDTCRDFFREREVSVEGNFELYTGQQGLEKAIALHLEFEEHVELLQY